jgi:glycosyltransferase involved in cell wall biosynthesis
MTGPAVSVVIPTYNYGRYLPRTLGSVLAQTFQDFEILILDDGSTDDTAAVVRPYLADPRIHYRRLTNGGPSRARNLGISRARAPVVAFLDADDSWLPAKLEKQMALFRRDPALGLVYTARRVVDEAGHGLEWQEPVQHRGHVLEALLGGNFICLTSCMVRRQVFELVGTFDEGLSQAEDYDLWLRIAEHYRFDYLAEPLVTYRMGHASLSRRLEERLRSVVFILHRFVQRRRGRIPVGLVRAKLADTYTDYAVRVRDRSRLRALPCFVRALVASPRHGPAWVGLGSLFLPERLRRLLRRALGKPVDWRVRQRIESKAA